MPPISLANWNITVYCEMLWLQRYFSTKIYFSNFQNKSCLAINMTVMYAICIHVSSRLVSMRMPKHTRQTIKNSELINRRKKNYWFWFIVTVLLKWMIRRETNELFADWMSRNNRMGEYLYRSLSCVCVTHSHCIIGHTARAPSVTRHRNVLCRVYLEQNFNYCYLMQQKKKSR